MKSLGWQLEVIVMFNFPGLNYVDVFAWLVSWGVDRIFISQCLRVVFQIVGGARNNVSIFDWKTCVPNKRHLFSVSVVLDRNST